MTGRRVLLAAALGGLLLAGLSGAARSQEELLAVGTAAPDFTLKNVDGQPVKLSELTKKNVVLVNFFFNG